MSDDQTFTIGQLASQVGVPISTVRFYERAGLLTPEARSGVNNYRRYGAKSLARLRFIRIAQESGLSLQDIAGLVEIADQKSKPCAQVQSVLRTRLARLDERLSELQTMKSAVETAPQTCESAPGAGLCSDIKNLSRT